MGQPKMPPAHKMRWWFDITRHDDEDGKPADDDLGEAGKKVLGAGATRSQTCRFHELA